MRYRMIQKLERVGFVKEKGVEHVYQGDFEIPESAYLAREWIDPQVVLPSYERRVLVWYRRKFLITGTFPNPEHPMHIAGVDDKVLNGDTRYVGMGRCFTGEDGAPTWSLYQRSGMSEPPVEQGFGWQVLAWRPMPAPPEVQGDEHPFDMI